MHDLQRDPWADDPPLVTETQTVYPERWGSTCSFEAGWGTGPTAGVRASAGVSSTATARGAAIAQHMAVRGLASIGDRDVPQRALLSPSSATELSPSTATADANSCTTGDANEPHDANELTALDSVEAECARGAAGKGGCSDAINTRSTEPWQSRHSGAAPPWLPDSDEVLGPTTRPLSAGAVSVGGVSGGALTGLGRSGAHSWHERGHGHAASAAQTASEEPPATMTPQQPTPTAAPQEATATAHRLAPKQVPPNQLPPVAERSGAQGLGSIQIDCLVRQWTSDRGQDTSHRHSEQELLRRHGEEATSRAPGQPTTRAPEHPTTTGTASTGTGRASPQSLESPQSVESPQSLESPPRPPAG